MGRAIELHRCRLSDYSRTVYTLLSVESAEFSDTLYFHSSQLPMQIQTRTQSLEYKDHSLQLGPMACRGPLSNQPGSMNQYQLAGSFK